MPRNSSGNYTLPAGNPVVAGTIIDVDWANPTMQDIAVQLNNVLTRDGLLGPIAPILAIDGTVSAPGLSFAANPTTGLYNSATGAGFAYLGVLFCFINSSGVRVAKPLILGNPTAPGTPLADGDLNVAGKIYINGVEFNIYTLLSSPPPIGDVTPNTGAFTTLKAAGVDVATLSAIQTLTNKTLTTPVLSNPSYSGTTANGGTVTTIDINGGTIDGVTIGSTTPAAGSFTTLSASGQIQANAAGPAIKVTGVVGNPSYAHFNNTAQSGKIWRVGYSGGTGGSQNTFDIFDETDNINVGVFSSSGLAVTGALSASGGVTNTAGRSNFSSNDAYAIGAKNTGGGPVYFGATDSTASPGGHIANSGGADIISWTNAGAVTIPGSVSTGALTASTWVNSTVSNPFDTPNVILKTVNSTVGNYSAIQNYNYSGAANAAILFVNDGQSAYPNNGGSIAFATYAGGGAAGTVKMTIAANGNTTFNSGTFGYGIGAGGTVTQATSKSTAVTLNKPCGQITMNNAALAAGDLISFYLFNNHLSVASGVVITGCNDGVVNPSNYKIEATSIVNGDRVLISVTNRTGGSLSEALVFNFQVISGATS